MRPEVVLELSFLGITNLDSTYERDPTTFGKSWSLSLREEVWILCDHKEEIVGHVPRDQLHDCVSIPNFWLGGWMRNKFPSIRPPSGLEYCFAPEKDMVRTLERFILLSELSTAPITIPKYRRYGSVLLIVALFFLLALAAAVVLTILGGFWSKPTDAFSIIVFPFLAVLISFAMGLSYKKKARQ